MIEPISRTDVPLIVTEDVFKAFVARSPNPMMKHADYVTIVSGMIGAAMDGDLVAVGDYLVLVAVARQWWSPKLFLMEEFSVRFRNKYGNPPGDIAAYIHAEAERRGCVAACVGDMQIGAMIPHYQAAGFIPIGMQLIKETTHGCNPQTHGGAGAG